MLFEKLINQTISFYQKHDVAIFHKLSIPVSISGLYQTPKALIASKAIITSKSTVDYYGVYEGHFVAFEAKSIDEKTFPIANIKEHQREYIRLIEKHGGIGFYLIFFTRFNQIIFLREKSLGKVKEKSLSFEHAQKIGISLNISYPGIVDFLNMVIQAIKNK